MEWLCSSAIIILAAFVHATLQLGVGTQLLLYHASRGKHILKKTRRIMGSYISGLGIVVFLMLAAACFVLLNCFGGTLEMTWLIVLVVILIALALLVWLFYYRWGKGTELWILKVMARYIDGRAKVTNNDTEAFSLGALTCFAELPFSLVLFVVAGNSVLAMKDEWQLLMIAIYTIIVILPLLIMRFAIRRGETVVSVQRWRVKNKHFLKIISGAGFLILGLVILAFKIMVG